MDLREEVHVLPFLFPPTLIVVQAAKRRLQGVALVQRAEAHQPRHNRWTAVQQRRPLSQNLSLVLKGCVVFRREEQYGKRVLALQLIRSTCQKHRLLRARVLHQASTQVQ